MTSGIRKLWRLLTGSRTGQQRGLTLLLPCSAIVSLAYAGYFLPV